jgi:hypothetical protein
MWNVIKYVLLALAGLLVIGLVWGLVEPYTISEEQSEVELRDLPGVWREREIAIISDFQVGMWLDNTWTIRRIVDRLVEKEPSLVLILGDFIYKGGEVATGRIEKAAGLLAPLGEAGIPVYAVLGNHDYSVVSSHAPDIDEERAGKLAAALEEAGVTVVQNDSVAVLPFGAQGEEGEEGDALYLVGIGAHMPEKDRPVRALEDVPEDAARLVMMHNPDTFAEVPAEAAPVAVAGHTHGGQVRLPFTPEWTYLTYLAEDNIHADGWIEDYGKAGNRLYVNRGVGFSKLPLRINCPPEITLFTLRRTTD